MIAGGTLQERCKSFEIQQKHRNNRILQGNRKGFKPSIRRQRYKIQPKDLVWVNNKVYISKGARAYGKYIRLVGPIKQISTGKINKIYHFGGFSFSL